MAATTPTGSLVTMMRLLGDDDAAPLPRRGDGVAIDAARFLGEPLHIGGAHAHLAARLGQRLALLKGEENGEILLILADDVSEAKQDLRPLAGGFRPPGRKRRLSCGDGASGLGPAAVGHAAEMLAGRRIGDIEGLAGIGAHPLSGDQVGVALEGKIGQHGVVPEGWLIGAAEAGSTSDD